MMLEKIFKFRRIPPLASLLAVLIVLACGTIAVDYSADFRSHDDVTIVMELSLTDMFVAMAADSENSLSPNNPDFDGWKTEILEDEVDKYTVRLSNTFKGQTAEDLLNPERANRDAFLPVIYEVDKGEYIEYRIEFPTEFFSDDDLVEAEDDFEEDIEAAMAGMLKMNIKLKVFGEILETNANQTVENEFTWRYNLVSFNEAGKNNSLLPYVVTRVNKSSGIFGSCN